MKALKYLSYVGKLAGFVSALNVIPFGARQSFTFRINIKAAMLRDLKLEARGSNGQLLF